MTSETGVPDFPALVELANRLKGKDRKICELALYTLKKQDERLAKRDERIAELEAFRRDAFKEVAELARECGSLRAALSPFSKYQTEYPEEYSKHPIVGKFLEELRQASVILKTHPK